MTDRCQPDGPMAVHGFSMNAGGPCFCGAYASVAAYEAAHPRPKKADSPGVAVARALVDLLQADSDFRAAPGYQMGMPPPEYEALTADVARARESAIVAYGEALERLAWSKAPDRSEPALAACGQGQHVFSEYAVGRICACGRRIVQRYENDVAAILHHVEVSTPP